jgi:ABC-2 type transport system ATP-binding protein
MPDAGGYTVIAERLGRRYGRTRRWAIRGITIELPARSVTALVGPNGAGKSTLIRTWIGFERPDEGHVSVAGHDLAVDRRRAVESVGYVPQAAALYRGLSIKDHLTMAIAARPRFDVSFANESLLNANLTADRKVGELSGGEQAKVALAIALACRPAVLLLDEPLASLDPLARREFLATLSAYAKAHETTVVLSSHIITDIEQVCDRLVVLSGGRLALHTDIATARRSYRTSPVDDPDAPNAIGVFAGPDGRLLRLHQDHRKGVAATLEEVTLGFLASDRGGAVAVG